MAGHPIKNHLVAFLGEFVGTFLFLFFAFAGTQTANLPPATSDVAVPQLLTLMYISLVFGFSLAVSVWVFFRVSGGLYNPAVTLALCIVGVVPVVRSIFIFIAQILGSMAAAAVVRGIIPGNSVNFAVTLGPNVTIAQGLFIEMFLTIELVFTILMLAAEKTKTTFIAPVGIGLALFVAELVGVKWTGGSLNPARAFGPAVALGQFPNYHWLYWIGPILGALVASGFYKLLKVLKYEEVNGTQDLAEHEEKMLEANGHGAGNGNGNGNGNGTVKGHAKADRSERRSREGRGVHHQPSQHRHSTHGQNRSPQPSAAYQSGGRQAAVPNGLPTEDQVGADGRVYPQRGYAA